MAKYLLKSEEYTTSFSFTGEATEQQLLQHFQKKNPEDNWTVCIKVPRGKHICKYCGEIAEGTYVDLLCTDCRETFGHSLYSEL